MDNQEKQVINQAENQPQKPGRGGKRPGAGRPKGDGTSKLYAFRADKEVAAYLDSQENKTDFIKECIIRQMEVAKSRQEDEALRQLGEVMPTSRIKPMSLPFFRNYESIKINAGDKFAHVSVGNLQHFEGKQFVKEATEANSCEISFGSLPSGESVPFFHTHENNEENYIILSGSGKFQVNDSVFDISEGSVVRVSTHCDRCLKCTSDAPMLYLCIQAKENSLGGYTLDDAAITERVSLL